MLIPMISVVGTPGVRGTRPSAALDCARERVGAAAGGDGARDTCAIARGIGLEQPKDGQKHPLIRVAEKGKRVVAGFLLIMMFVLLGIAVVELFWLPLTYAIPGIAHGEVLLTESELLGAFGLFLSVLIALELVETVEVYFKDHQVHAEIVLLVAMIALARKVVLLDLTKYSPLSIIGIASLFFGLAAAYMAIKWAKQLGPERSGEE